MVLGVNFIRSYTYYELLRSSSIDLPGINSFSVEVDLRQILLQIILSGTDRYVPVRTLLVLPGTVSHFSDKYQISTKANWSQFITQICLTWHSTTTLPLEDQRR